MSHKAEVIADSINSREERILTFRITYPFITHAEMCSHGPYSRNRVSDIDAPFSDLVKEIKENPFIPIAWPNKQKGVEGTEYLTDPDDINGQVDSWLKARNEAVHYATELNQDGGVTKQLCTKLLQPFSWVTEIVTGTQWNNFFYLCCPRYKTQFGEFLSKKDAIIAELDITGKNPNTDTLQSPRIDDTISWLQINESQADVHVQTTAELMWDAMGKSKYKKLASGEWHIPLEGTFDENRLMYMDSASETVAELKVKIATARCFRGEGKGDYEDDIKFYDILRLSKPPGLFNHCARAMSNSEYNSFRVHDDNPSSHFGKKGICKNFKGFIPLEHLV